MKKKEKVKKNPYVMFFDKRLLKYHPFVELSGTAKLVYLVFRERCRMEQMNDEWEITNNGQLVFSYSEADKKYGISRPAFARAISKLVLASLIYIAKSGGGTTGDFSKYGMSDEWQKVGTADFKPSCPRPIDTRNGFNTRNWEARTGRKKRPPLPPDIPVLQCKTPTKNK